MKKILLSLFIGMAVAVIGWSIYEKKMLPEVVETGQKEVHVENSIWLANWGFEQGYDIISRQPHQITNVALFHTYFDNNLNLYQTNQMKSQAAAFFAGEQIADNVYLTIVNDNFLQDGTVIQKDTTLLARLFRMKSMEAMHIEQILTFVSVHPYAGVELDYEKVADEDVVAYMAFIHRLNQELTKRGKKLRVVLEDRFPLQNVTIDPTIEVIVMAYNLYGTHSGPGPKADFDFLQKLLVKKEKINNVAFATGGFNWTAEDVKALSEMDAYQLQQQYQQVPVRDEQSAALHFRYEVEGVEHEVWYADMETLRAWQSYIIENSSIRAFSYWRASDLSKETSAFIFEEVGYIP